MEKRDLKVKEMVKKKLIARALAEMEENLEMGLVDYAEGVNWFMYHAGMWSFDTCLYISDRMQKNELPTMKELINNIEEDI